jgi:hypothetical protein
MTDLTHYTEGVCADGAAILRDGVMMPIEEIVSELNRLTALAQPEPAGDDGDVAIDRWIESRPDWPNNWPAVTQCQLNALIGEALEHWGRPAAPPAPAPEMVPVAVSDALIKAECSLSDIAEGEETIAAPNTFEWAEQRCAETLAIIRPVMTQHGIRTSEWPPQQLSAPAPAVVPVPVSERPWERNGWCDECGFFWAEHISRSDIPSWRYTCANDLGGWATRCLPFHALPFPAPQEVQP